MEQLRLREQTAENFEEAAFRFVGEVMAQNIDRTKDEVITSIKDVYQALSDVIPAMYDELISEPEFTSMAKKITEEAKDAVEKLGKKSEE